MVGEQFDFAIIAAFGVTVALGAAAVFLSIIWLIAETKTPVAFKLVILLLVWFFVSLTTYAMTRRPYRR